MLLTETEKTTLAAAPLQPYPVQVETHVNPQTLRPEVRLTNDGVGYVTLQGLTSLRMFITKLQTLEALAVARRKAAGVYIEVKDGEG